MNHSVVGDTSLYRPKNAMSMFAQAMRHHAAAEQAANDDMCNTENVSPNSSRHILQNNQLKQQQQQQQQQQQLKYLQKEDDSQRQRLKQIQRSFTYDNERRISTEIDAIEMEMENNDSQVGAISGKRSREQYERDFMFVETLEMTEA